MRRFFLLTIVGALVLAGCGDDDSDTQTSAGGTPTTAPSSTAGHDDHGGTPACSPSGTRLSLVASNIKFDKACLAVPAGQAFTVAFENKDTTPHSLVFAKSHSSNENLFPGADVFTGPKTVTVNAPPQPAGTYVFHCSIHPSVMNGDFVVQ